MKVGISGGTGLIGRQFARALLDRGDHVVVFSRNAERPRGLWEGAEFCPRPIPIDKDWEGLDAFANLAGESIAGVRWTDSVKERLVQSRVQHTSAIVESMSQSRTKPRVFLSASAIGYYGSEDNSQETRTEDSAPGEDFLAKLCLDWEDASRKAMQWGVRVVNPRIGVVLDPDGGALAKLLPVFRSFLGGWIATGDQGMSWIHREDLVRILLFLLDNPSLEGPFNATAPHPVSNREFSQILAKTLGRPCAVWTPAWVLRLAFGDGAVVVNQGQLVLPQRLLSAGFSYHFSQLDDAFASLLLKTS